MFSSIGGIIIRCCMQIFIITIYPQITKLVLFVNKLTSSLWTWNPSLLGLEQWTVILCVVFRNNQPHHTTFARDFPKSGTDLYKFHFHTLKHPEDEVLCYIIQFIPMMFLIKRHTTILFPGNQKYSMISGIQSMQNTGKYERRKNRDYRRNRNVAWCVNRWATVKQTFQQIIRSKWQWPLLYMYIMISKLACIEYFCNERLHIANQRIRVSIIVTSLFDNNKMLAIKLILHKKTDIWYNL